jgi:hypothetical protein
VPGVVGAVPGVAGAGQAVVAVLGGAG